MKKIFSYLLLTLLIFNNLFIVFGNEKDNSPQYSYSNFPLTGGTNIELYIELDSKFPYGKAFYYNNSSNNATLYVKGKPIKTIKPFSSDYIEFKKGIFKKSFNVSLTASKEVLNGSFSLAKAKNLEDFKK